MKFTENDIKKLLDQGKIAGFTVVGADSKKESKYHNKKIEIDGFVFDSLKESRRYVKLRMLVAIGEITNLRLQVPFELNEGGTHSLKYVLDFQYTDKNGNEIFEDVKGFRTKVYKKKRKLMKQVHGIEIREV